MQQVAKDHCWARHPAFGSGDMGRSSLRGLLGNWKRQKPEKVNQEDILEETGRREMTAGDMEVVKQELVPER